MDNQDSYDRARDDVLAMVAKWAEDGVKAEESLFAALSILLRATFEMAPSTKAAHGMLTVCFQESYQESEISEDIQPKS